RQGKGDEAVAAFRKAVALAPGDLTAHTNLATGLEEQGKFSEALVVLQQFAARLPAASADRPALAQRIRETARLVELDRELPAVLAGKAQPSGANGWVELAYFAHRQKRRPAAAARLWVRALAAGPGLAADPNSHRYNAAGCAALAGCGRGEDASEVDGQERHRWRRQALT